MKGVRDHDEAKVMYNYSKVTAKLISYRIKSTKQCLKVEDRTQETATIDMPRRYIHTHISEYNADIS